MIILGISCFYHDSAAAIIRDGKILFAAEEERFTRKKHDDKFPSNAVSAGLKYLGISISDIDAIVYYEKPLLKFDRLLETWINVGLSGYGFFMKSAPAWFSKKIFVKSTIRSELLLLGASKSGLDKKIYFSDHHLSHAASAYYPSPFNESAILTIDGVGEGSTTSIYSGSGNNITLLQYIKYPHSLGLLYSAFTAYCGFKVNSGEYKLMGLAPYGDPIYVDMILENLIEIHDDGSFALNLKYFNVAATEHFYNSNFCALFGGPGLPFNSTPRTKEMDLAASIQKVIEIALTNLAKVARKITNSENLCLAGGVALNCVANGNLKKMGIFSNIWVQPASGDSGGAIGSALAYYYLGINAVRDSRNHDDMNGALLGRSFNATEIRERLDKLNAKYSIFDPKESIKFIAKKISEGAVVGWFDGRAEFGPRALGSRSILADPRNPSMQKKLNLKIKYRESFRPFAPSILEECVADWFELHVRSPYMLMTAKIKNEWLKIVHDNDIKIGLGKINQVRSVIPAVTHVDYSARIQTVGADSNPAYRQLLKIFYQLTKVPILINTSFNVRGEPIVENIDDAYNCFMRTDIDYLYIQGVILSKDEQPENVAIKKEAVSLD